MSLTSRSNRRWLRTLGRRLGLSYAVIKDKSLAWVDTITREAAALLYGEQVRRLPMPRSSSEIDWSNWTDLAAKQMKRGYRLAWKFKEPEPSGLDIILNPKSNVIDLDRALAADLDTYRVRDPILVATSYRPATHHPLASFNPPGPTDSSASESPRGTTFAPSAHFAHMGRPGEFRHTPREIDTQCREQPFDEPLAEGHEPRAAEARRTGGEQVLVHGIARVALAVTEPGQQAVSAAAKVQAAALRTDRIERLLGHDRASGEREYGAPEGELQYQRQGRCRGADRERGLLRVHQSPVAPPTW